GMVEPIQTPPPPSAAGGRLPQLLGIAHQLCEALSYLHGEGVVHRDIKPSNVFVTPGGQPILVDFGLAVQVGDSGGREVLAPEVTTGGSARYMAPEQIRGEALDPRCDLYALGCVLFELVTGRTPFIGLLGEVIDQHQRRPAPQLGSLVRDVPPELERLVRRLLAKDRRDRLGYAHDVSAILARAGAQPVPWSRPGPRARTYLYRPPLVGRQDVLREFERLYRQLPAAHGGVAFLCGESGVGKTRCALELAANATRAGIEVIVGGCTTGAIESGEAGRSAPLEPLRPWLRRIADLCIEGGEREAARWLGASAPLLAEYEPTFAQFVTSESQLAHWPAAAARAALYRSLIDLLRTFTARTPLMLIIDDLQWSDELTLGFLQRLAAIGLHDMRLIVLGLVRTDEAIDALTTLMQDEHVRSFDLPRLNHSDVGRMVAGMLSLDEATREFVQFLSDKSEGNAFFVAEYLRIAVAEQVLIRNDLGQWCLAESTEPTQVLCESLPLPQSLRELVARRTADLGERTRALMLLAATVGRNVDVGLLRRAAGVSDDEVLEAVTDLVQRHVLETVAGGSGFRFVHDKLREIPYAELPNDQRKQLHRRVALALESPAADGGGAFDETNSGVFRTVSAESAAVGGQVDHGALGQHWLLAGEPLRAIVHLHAAGDAAERMSALDQTVVFYRSALGALAEVQRGADPSAANEWNGERATLDEKLADVLALLGSLDEARQAYEDALDVRAIGDGLARARVLRKLGKTWETSHDHPRALDAYAAAEAAVAKVERSDPVAIQEHTQLQLNRVWIHYWLADVDRMSELLEGIAHYVEHEAPALTRSNYFGALVKRDFRAHRYRISEPIIAHARSCLRAAEDAKAPVESAFARFDVGFALLFAGQIEAAEVELNGALVATRRLGDTTSEIRCLTYITLARRFAQSVQETEQLALETVERARRANMNDYVALAQS
ncbi:MAG TPA: AAA family ATPase, partial [Polyangiales bacterium]|nr:AAA family ATPase [Polyangiales bacterium]